MDFIHEVLKSQYTAPFVMMIISFFTSMSGVSGAFLLLPYQMSVMGLVNPSVSSTNQLYNIVAIPGGLWNFIRNDNMLWRLALIVISGTLPGVFIGSIIRLEYLPDPENFKLFAGFVLLYLGFRLSLSYFKKESKKKENFDHKITHVSFSIKEFVYRFDDEEYRAPSTQIFLVSLVVGAVGGIYGIGGGALMSPLLVAVYGLPVYTVAGAALLSTFTTSIAAVLFYQYLSLFYPDISVAPDWTLGFLFGIGGLAGIFLGSKFQKHFSQLFIKLILTACILFIALLYIVGYFF